MRYDQILVSWAIDLNALYPYYQSWFYYPVQPVYSLSQVSGSFNVVRQQPHYKAFAVSSLAARIVRNAVHRLLGFGP